MISGFAFLLLLFFLRQSGLTAGSIKNLAIDAQANADKLRGNQLRVDIGIVVRSRRCFERLSHLAERREPLPRVAD